jgi:hypothetical protein
VTCRGLGAVFLWVDRASPGLGILGLLIRMGFDGCFGASDMAAGLVKTCGVR